VPLRPQNIYLNSNGSRLAILDLSGVLKLFEFPKPSVDNISGENVGGRVTHIITEGGKLLDFERKDVWDVKWFVLFKNG
jgi:WD repeat-containing protein 35